MSYEFLERTPQQKPFLRHQTGDILFTCLVITETTLGHLYETKLVKVPNCDVIFSTHSNPILPFGQKLL